MDGVVRFLGSVNLLSFFVSDLYFAFVLSQLKKDHPSIDDCAPPPPPNSGYGALGAGEDGNGGGSSSGPTRNYQEAPTDPVSLVLDAARNRGNGEIANLFNGINPRHFARSGASGTYNDIEVGESHEDQLAHQKQRIIHLGVIIASFCAPFFSLMQILFPSVMGWSMFHSPTWIGYLATVPAFVVVVIYAARALRIGSFVEVSKAQWLSLAWFRLDVMIIMGLLLLIGWGDWLVAVCLFVVGLYLAFRLLQTERRLAQVVQSTQLLRPDQNGGASMEEMIGMSGGAGVVRSAIIAGEQYSNGVGGGSNQVIGFAGGRSYGYNNPDDVFEGRAEAVGSSPLGYGDYGGADGGNNNNTYNSRRRAVPDFSGNNEPTDSERELGGGGSRGGGGTYHGLGGGDDASGTATSVTEIPDPADDVASPHSASSSKRKGGKKRTD